MKCLTLVDCDHIVNKKYKWTHDRIGRRLLGYVHAEDYPDRYRVIPNFTDKNEWAMETVEFFTSTARMSRYRSM